MKVKLPQTGMRRYIGERLFDTLARYFLTNASFGMASATQASRVELLDPSSLVLCYGLAVYQARETDCTY